MEIQQNFFVQVVYANKNVISSKRIKRLQNKGTCYAKCNNGEENT
jgi:hypothetical protein